MCFLKKTYKVLCIIFSRFVICNIQIKNNLVNRLLYRARQPKKAKNVLIYR